ncbi:glycosyltransferase family 39 protein [Streptomyces indicus]|uniref:glycosyltransferase family 39 protein n=1 Tax=Streptomyces indicus TaxID=417292 RepID=UPI00115FFAAA|nr:glycosyltransferase family 39 protein [Streptomyces indicus]
MRTPAVPAARRPAEPAPEPSRTRGHRHWSLLLVVVLPAVAIGLLGHHRRWVGDDALIYTRAVRQILAGNGPVLNLGERAESSTGTLWQWLVALGGLLTSADPALVAVALGLVTTVAGWLLAGDAARRLFPGRARLLPVGALVLLPVPAVWDYATSGLETGLATCWLAACWWLLVRAYRSTSPSYAQLLCTAVVFGLGPLVRPDLALVTGVFLVVGYALLRPRPRRALGLGAAALALPLAYEIFRAGYYGVLVPLPGLTKEASQAVWLRGLAYAWNFVGPYHLWTPALLLLALLPLARKAAASRRALLLAAAPVVSGLLCLVYVVRVGGDFMHARMLLPGLFLVLLPLWALPLSRRVAATAGGLGVWACCCLLLWRAPAESAHFQVYDQHLGYQRITGVRHPTEQRDHRVAGNPYDAQVRRAAAGGRPTLVIETGFNRSYRLLPLSERFGAPVAGTRVMLGHGGLVVPLDGLAVDPQGLSYPLAAHVERTRIGKAGHDKRLPEAWIIADYTDPGTALPPGVDASAVAAARRALSCGPLAELQDSVRAPLTFDRFLRNLTGSWQRTSFRFPADPHEAEAALCPRR